MMNNTPMLPERCFVTLLAVDVVSSTNHVRECDPDDIQLFQDAIFERVQSCINNASGHVISFAGDGGIAVFGWPNSLETHSDLAVQAAQEIHKISTGSEPIFGPQGDLVEFRVGIHSGLVGMRQITLASVSRTDTVGETVHLAVTLQKEARPNEILVSSHTLELCSNKYPVNRRADVKYFDSKKRCAYSLTNHLTEHSQSKEIQEYSGSIVGRNNELKQILDLLPNSHSSFSFLGLVGDAGIGKTRLVSELLFEAKNNKDCLAIGINNAARTVEEPYSTIRQIMDKIARSKGGGLSSLRRRLGNEYGFSKSQAGAIVLALGLPVRDMDGDDGFSKQAELQRLLTQAIHKLTADQPFLLIVEDIQWIDPESRECLRLLVSDNSRSAFSILVTGRPEIADNIRQLGDNILFIGPLDNDCMHQLASNLDCGKPSHVINQAIKKSDGIPFILEQILLSLKEGRIDTANITPISVQSLIHARLNKLSPEAKQLAQELSQLGQQTTRAIATKVSAFIPSILSQKLAELERHQFIFPQQDTIRFRHQIIVEACASTVPKSRSIAIHNSAVRAISSTYANLEPHYMSLAFHARMANDRARELDFLKRAALHARRTSAMQSLKTIFKLAVKALPSIYEDREQTHLEFVLIAGPSLLQIGEFKMAEQNFPQALAFGQSNAGKAQQCGVLCQSATLCWFQGKFNEGKQYSSQAMTIAREVESMPLLFSSLIIHSINCWVLGDLEEAVCLQEEICQTFSNEIGGFKMGAAATPGVMARVFLGWSILESGKLLEAENLAEEALTIAEELNDSYGITLALNFYGFAKFVSGEFEAATSILKRALKISIRNGFDNSKATVIGNLSAALASCGDHKAALTMADDWMAEDHSSIGVIERLYAMRGFAEANAKSGRSKRALKLIDQAVRLARSVGSPCFEARMLETRIAILNKIPAKNKSVLANDLRRLEDIMQQLKISTLFLSQDIHNEELPVEVSSDIKILPPFAIPTKQS